MLAKPPQYVPTYLSSIVSQLYAMMLKSMRKSKNRYFYHIFVFCIMFPWGRPWGNHAKCCMDGKRIRCLQIVSQHVSIYLQQFPRYSNCKCKKSPFSRTAAHIFVSPGDAPATITMSRGLSGLRPRPGPSSLMIAVPNVTAQPSTAILSDVAPLHSKGY